jgi:hypothetical protein
MASLLDDIAMKRSLILRLITGMSASGLANVLLGVAVLVLAMRDTRDWFVPATGPGFLRPGELVDSYVAEEAQGMAMLQQNWTHETLEAVQKQFERLLDPPLRKTYKEKTAPEERKAVKEHKIVLSQFVATGVDVLKRQGQKRRVLVHGIRTLYIGSTPSSEPVTIDMGLEPDRSAGRPTGLKIMSLVPSPPLKVAGR